MSEKKNREEEISEQQEAAQPAECAEQTPAEEAESAAGKG